MINISDKNMGLSGELHVQVFDAHSGELLKEFIHKNLIVTLGKTNVVKLLGGNSAGQALNKVGVGTNGTAPALTDTTLTSSFIKAVDSAIFPDANSVKFSFEILPAEANGKTIREFGLFNNSTVLFSRKNHADIVKTSSIRLAGSWTITVA